MRFVTVLKKPNYNK